MAVIVPHDPNSRLHRADRIEMIGKTVKVAAAQPTANKMEELWILQSLAHSGSKFAEEIIPKALPKLRNNVTESASGPLGPSGEI